MGNPTSLGRELPDAIRIYSIFDSKAERYMRPFFAPNDAVAQRSFEAAVRQPDHEFHQFAEDYTLFHIGFFDEINGALVDTPARSVTTAIALRSAFQKRAATEAS